MKKSRMKRRRNLVPLPQANDCFTMASQDESPPIRPHLRVLCLHDSHSNATELKESLELLGNTLYQKHGHIDLVYVNSPLDEGREDDSNDPLKRSWWNEVESSDDGEEGASGGSSFHGLDASLMLLQQIWASCPFWGILGVGQGAAVASLLALLPTIHPPPHFCIFISGKALLPEEERLACHVTCLHLVDAEKNDHRDQDRLFVQFGGIVHERSSSERITKSDLNAVGRFLVDQKKKLRLGDGDGDIVALQSALHLIELQAADKIAEEIASNPPNSLMAVIRPQGVAGWSGNKRRQPGEEGGGAPCPSEFLLKRDKRPTNLDTASRVHPKASSM